jgi:hypothetical protein
MLCQVANIERRFKYMDSFDFITTPDSRLIRRFLRQSQKGPAPASTELKDLQRRLRGYLRRKTLDMDANIESLPKDERLPYMQTTVGDMVNNLVSQGRLPRMNIRVMKDQYAVQMYMFAQEVDEASGQRNEASGQTSNEARLTHGFNYMLVLSQIGLVIRDLKGELEDEKANQAMGIEMSRSRSAPASLSADTPADVERRYSRSYNRHAKLSVVTPTKATAAPPPGPAPTRQVLLQELRDSCRAMKDYISFEGFGKLRKSVLQSVAKVAVDAKGKHSCYTARNLYRLWITDQKQGKAVRDPATRVPLTVGELDDVMAKVLRTNPEAVDPRTTLKPGYARLRLVVNHVDVQMPDGKVHAFYALSIMYVIRPLYLRVGALGFVPAGMEPEHFSKYGRPVNYSSGVLITHLKDLFEHKRLMIKHAVPYKCCKMHLGKSIEYWLDPQDPTGISQERFKLMMDEVDQLLAGLAVGAVGGSGTRPPLKKMKASLTLRATRRPLLPVKALTHKGS